MQATFNKLPPVNGLGVKDTYSSSCVKWYFLIQL